MGLFSKLFKYRDVMIPGKLYPEYYWQVSIEKEILKSSDWQGNQREIDLSKLQRIYIRTTDTGPWSCDVWWGIETHKELIEIPQGCNGEDEFLKFARALPYFRVTAMHSTENKIHECWNRDMNKI